MSSFNFTSISGKKNSCKENNFNLQSSIITPNLIKRNKSEQKSIFSSVIIFTPEKSKLNSKAKEELNFSKLKFKEESDVQEVYEEALQALLKYNHDCPYEFIANYFLAASKQFKINEIIKNEQRK